MRRWQQHSEHMSIIEYCNWHSLHKSMETVFIIPFFGMVSIRRDLYITRISVGSHGNPHIVILPWSHFADTTSRIHRRFRKFGFFPCRICLRRFSTRICSMRALLNNSAFRQYIILNVHALQHHGNNNCYHEDKYDTASMSWLNLIVGIFRKVKNDKTKRSFGFKVILGEALASKPKAL